MFTTGTLVHISPSTCLFFSMFTHGHSSTYKYLSVLFSVHHTDIHQLTCTFLSCSVFNTRTGFSSTYPEIPFCLSCVHHTGTDPYFLANASKYSTSPQLLPYAWNCGSIYRYTVALRHYLFTDIQRNYAIIYSQIYYGTMPLSIYRYTVALRH